MNMNNTPIWSANDIHGMHSPLSNSIQLPTFKVNMDTESVRSGYSDRSKRSRGHASHSVSHSNSNNVLAGNHTGNHVGNHIGNHHNHVGNHLGSNHVNHTNHHPYGNHSNHRNHNHTSGHNHRSASRHSHRSTRSDRQFVSKLESPDERHEGGVGQEVIEVQILPQDDNWGDNTTCVTGNTSDHSVSIGDDMNKIGKDLWREQSMSFRCQMWSGTVVTAFLCLCAFASPLLMVVLPKVDALEWKTVECGPECDGLLISFAFKLLILLVGGWAIFVRRPRATMPRIFIYRAIVLALIFVFMVSYWLFYLVRIAEKRFNDYDLVTYHSIVLFAVSLVDALLFIHYLAVVLIEIRHLQPQYYIKVVRSPDGKSRSYNIGQLSIQRAAVWVLEKYYQDFDIFNPYLESLPTKKSRKSGHTSNHINATTAAIKYYDIDGITSAGNNTSVIGSTSMGINITNSNRSFITGMNGSTSGDLRNRRDRTDRADRGDTSSHHHSHHHNERFYEEHEYDRRVRKRRARLVTATEDAFTHIKRIQDERGL
ncbi:unnamed protein product [Medioppia subpectinata]|uniref:Uncharacterized protein n=1 Tax=Medioppia subpectinata TaxID=1979941 RepID=A0A7R9L4D4_9ACAR|nr:unnamed protein product [Medioppia subpectinata]CAG2115107.1 unnamed protein product [Medioppia subpectinata]